MHTHRLLYSVFVILVHLLTHDLCWRVAVHCTACKKGPNRDFFAFRCIPTTQYVNFCGYTNIRSNCKINWIIQQRESRFKRTTFCVEFFIHTEYDLHPTANYKTQKTANTHSPVHTYFRLNFLLSAFEWLLVWYFRSFDMRCPEISV